MKNERSVTVLIAFGKGWKKLGQPVPLSNLVSDENSGRSQPAQAKVPLRFSLLSGLVPARSVPCLRSTLYCSALRRLCHSASLRFLKSMACSDVLMVSASLNLVVAASALSEIG